MLIPQSDLIHAVRVYRRSVTQGSENQAVPAYGFTAELRGLVVPRSARFDRDTREYVATETLVLTQYAAGIVEGQWVKCLDSSGQTVLLGEITEVIDPNLIHDHLELKVRKGEAEIDV